MNYPPFKLTNFEHVSRSVKSMYSNKTKNMKLSVLTAISFFSLLIHQTYAQTNQLKDTFKIEKQNTFYPSISAGRSFNSNDFKCGINLIMYNEITKYKKNHDTFNLIYHIPKHLGYIQNKRPVWVHHSSVEFVSVFTINHHFIKDSNNRTINSQSFEYAIFCENILNNMVGLGLQVKHYNFETFSFSPQIKLLPPFVNLYAQMNFYQETKLSIPKYEFGVEFNPRLLYEIGKYLLKD